MAQSLGLWTADWRVALDKIKINQYKFVPLGRDSTFSVFKIIKMTPDCMHFSSLDFFFFYTSLGNCAAEQLTEKKKKKSNDAGNFFHKCNINISLHKVSPYEQLLSLFKTHFCLLLDFD